MTRARAAIDEATTEMTSPICNWCEVDGHEPDCLMAALLAALAAEEETPTPSAAETGETR